MSDYQEEVWTYAGIRMGGDGKKVDTWEMTDGQEVTFPPRGSHAIGHKYVVRVWHKDGTVSKSAMDQYSTGITEDAEPKVGGWTALHRAAQTELGRRSVEKKASQEDALDRAMGPLLDMAATVGPAQRAAFTAYVLHKLYTRGGW